MKKIGIALGLTAGILVPFIDKAFATSDFTFEQNYTASNTYDVEPNNGVAQAQKIKTNDSLSGFVDASSNDKSDYYQVVITEPGVLNVAVESFISSTTRIIILDDNNNELNNSINGSSEANPYKFKKDVYLDNGTYYIAVNTVYNTDAGSYNLKTNFTPSETNEIEPNNGTAQAQPLEFGQEVNGFISWSDREDYYKFHVNKTMNVTFNLDGYLNSRTRIEILNENNKEVFSTSIGSSPVNMGKISKNISLDKGDYFVKVSGSYSSDYGEYNLHIEGDGITAFADYKAGEYWVNSFAWGVKEGFIKGDSSTNRLNPYKDITEAQSLAMMLRYAYPSKAKDAIKGNWYDTYYTLADTLDIKVNHTPNATLRRGDVAVMLVHIYTKNTMSEQKAIDWLYTNGVTTASTYSEFNANNSITRAQVITFIYRLNENGINPLL